MKLTFRLVFMNGLLQRKGIDYEWAWGKLIFIGPLEKNDSVTVVWTLGLRKG